MDRTDWDKNGGQREEKFKNRMRFVFTCLGNELIQFPSQAQLEPRYFPNQLCMQSLQSAGYQIIKFRI